MARLGGTLVTLLVVAAVDAPAAPLVCTTDPDEITAVLTRAGVQFEQWETEQSLADGASQVDVLNAYRADVDRIAETGGYVSVDVVRLHRGPLVTDEEWATQAAGARSKFLAEHTHADDEVRFFVEGSGAFYLRIDEKVHIVVCRTGDFISVPANTRHWFDMGADPGFAAIRFFKVPEGWVGNFTGDDIATRFPTYDELVVAAS
jgi:1,2-dihydroxy-3-keto-5-methylthiopentene dioxygenase